MQRSPMYLLGIIILIALGIYLLFTLKNWYVEQQTGSFVKETVEKTIETVREKVNPPQPVRTTEEVRTESYQS